MYLNFKSYVFCFSVGIFFLLKKIKKNQVTATFERAHDPDMFKNVSLHDDWSRRRGKKDLY